MMCHCMFQMIRLQALVFGLIWVALKCATMLFRKDPSVIISRAVTADPQMARACFSARLLFRGVLPVISIPLVKDFYHPTLSVQQLAPDTFVPFSPRGEYINPAPEHDERINEVLDKELNYMLRVRVVDVDRAEQLWVIGIEEEFRIGYTEAIRDELITIYREELDMPFVETEYLRLSLAYPDKKPRKLLSMLRASLRHSVDYGMTYRQLVRRYTYQRSRANYNNANLQIDLIEQIFNLDLSEISGNGNKDRRTSLRHSSTFDSYIRLAFEYPEKSYDEIVAHLDAGYRIKYWELL